MNSIKHNDLLHEEQRLLDSFKMHEIEARLGDEDEALVDYNEKSMEHNSNENADKQQLYQSEAIDNNQVDNYETLDHEVRPADEVPLEQKDPLEGTFGNPNVVVEKIHQEDNSPEKETVSENQTQKVAGANPFHWEDDNLSRLVVY